MKTSETHLPCSPSICEPAPNRRRRTHGRRTHRVWLVGRRQIRDDLARLPGVKESETWGYPRREVRVSLDAGRLAALRIPLTQVLQAIGGESVNIPGGSVDAGKRRFNVKTSGSYRSLDEVRETVIGAGAGATVRVEDVARRMHEVIDEMQASGELEASFDMIVHSTGGLVARAWLTTHYRGRAQDCPLKRLVMLAPANYGSKLAATGTGAAEPNWTEYDLTLDYRFAAKTWPAWAQPFWIRGRAAYVDQRSDGNIQDYRIIVNYEWKF